MDNVLKTLSKTDTELRVANHIVLWGGQDLTGEHFTPNTQFDSPFTAKNAIPVDWEHGLDFDPDSPQRDDVLGWVDWSTAKKTDRGLWVERVLDRRNEYMQYLEALIEEGMIGTSSEATRSARRTAKGEIQVWPIKRDALTVQPAEPRMMSENAIRAVKSLADKLPSLKALIPQEAGEASGRATETDDEGQEDKPHKARKGATRGATMTDKTYSAEEVLELIKAGKDALPEDRARIPDALKSHEDQLAEVKSQMGQMSEVLDMIAKSPALKDAGYVAPDSEEDHANSKSWGDFLVAVRTGNTKRLQTVYKAAMAEGSGATGGYIVPTEFGGLLEPMVNELSVMRRAGVARENMASQEKEIAVVDVETAPSAGDTAYAGGAIGYWTAEAASVTESEPSFKLIRLVAHKLAGLALASNEVRDDAAESIDGLLARSFAKAIASKENYAFFRGDGVGKPRGILEGGAWSAQTRSAASAVALADVAKIMGKFIPDGRGAWFYNPAVLEKLIQIVSNPIAWLENARQGVPNLLMGYPMYATGALPGLNTAGDIMLVDLDSYLVGDRGGLEIAFSEHYKFANDQGAWRVTRRVDGQPLIDATITLENASTTVSPFVGLAAG